VPVELFAFFYVCQHEILAFSNTLIIIPMHIILIENRRIPCCLSPRFSTYF